MAETVLCPSCGTANETDRKFCGECGSALARACPSCGTPNPPTVKFCGECGTRLTGGPTPGVPFEPTAPSSERRLVTVLFADLVGFTAASENRDSEETRELLSRYFETARTVIERYGGTVEKFIGDAVMAVWGAPVAQEDDAERGVRAALELVSSVPELDPALKARAGVLTGEAAVTLGAEGQGMVAGDLVNTASRIQSAADPGTVLVGDTTRRAAEAAVFFESAGTHALKGKAEPVEFWRALRVVGLRGGAAKATGLEPPFVGRDGDLRLVKELFHTTAENRHAHLVSVVGVGGIGKSRLAWEFEKYIDGLAGDVWWHSGRCLAYGDGVAFWALAEMVRGRAGIVEDEEAESARSKLRAAIEEHLPDPQERRFVEPRLAHLLGLEEAPIGDQENLFAAARMFFERLAQEGPAVLLFEDIHWADSALLDFVEYLIEWSREVPLFVLTLARPELADRRPTWGSGRRSFTSIFLEPLPTEAMETLLAEPVPGLSDELRARILERAEGVPFYAVETVRMLLDRGILVREGNSYRLEGEIETLEVPETLQALIAARLDGLTPEERRAIQQAAVLGRTFTSRGLAAVSGLETASVESLLASLVRKEIVSLSSDPLSPERGQYGFLQDLVKKVAYDMLSRKDRKALHLAAAAHLLSLGDEDEMVEVVASHYLDAYAAAPDDADSAEIRAQARDMLVRAAERAASLAANTEAQHAYERALGLTDDPVERAELHERAGLTAHTGARPDEAALHFERAIGLLEQADETHAGARVEARLAQIMWDGGRLEEGLERMDRSYQALSREEPDADLADLAAQLGRFLFFAGRNDLALQRIESALRLAEDLALPETFSQALNTKAIMLVAQGRKLEGVALLRFALEMALEHDKPSSALRGYFNLADCLCQADRYEEAEECVRDGLDFARRIGNRYQELLFLGQNYCLFALGQWDEILERTQGLPEDWQTARGAFGSVSIFNVAINTHRGQLAEAERWLTLLDDFASSADVQEVASHACGRATLLLARGKSEDAAQAAQIAVDLSGEMGFTQEYVKEGLVVALEASLELGDSARTEKLLALVEALPAASRPHFLRAQALRFRARLASAGGDEDADRLFRQAVGLLRELALPYYLARTQLEHGEWLVALERTDAARPLLDEARETFERLEAAPWLERVDRVAGPERVPA